MENSGVNVYPPPRVGANSIGLQKDPGQKMKKSKFGKFWEGDTAVEDERFAENDNVATMA